jgi:hypothetical protein
LSILTATNKKKWQRESDIQILRVNRNTEYTSDFISRQKTTDKIVKELKKRASHQECQSARHFTLNKRQTDIGIFITRDLKHCATTGCLISNNRDLNAAKNILIIFKRNKKKEKLIEKRFNRLIQELETAILA